MAFLSEFNKHYNSWVNNVRNSYQFAQTVVLNQGNAMSLSFRADLAEKRGSHREEDPSNDQGAEVLEAENQEMTQVGECYRPICIEKGPTFVARHVSQCVHEGRHTNFRLFIVEITKRT